MQELLIDEEIMEMLDKGAREKQLPYSRPITEQYLLAKTKDTVITHV